MVKSNLFMLTTCKYTEAVFYRNKLQFFLIDIGSDFPLSPQFDVLLKSSMRFLTRQVGVILDEESEVAGRRTRFMEEALELINSRPELVPNVRLTHRRILYSKNTLR